MIETSCFKLKQIKRNYDSSVQFDVELLKSVNVQEFVQSLVNIQEWLYGTVTIKAYVPNDMPGKQLAKFDNKTGIEPHPNAYYNCKIIEAKAYGSYGLLDFTLKIDISCDKLNL